jgi:hypothetical protein
LPFENSFAYVTDAPKGNGLINHEGKYTIEPPGFENQPIVSEGFIAVNQSGNWGCMDRNGLRVVKPDYSGAAPFGEGMAGVKKDGKWG